MDNKPQTEQENREDKFVSPEFTMQVVEPAPKKEHDKENKQAETSSVRKMPKL